jgi:hypothetical protein
MIEERIKSQHGSMTMVCEIAEDKNRDGSR